MTATIEPRLIHLLNEATTPQLSSTDLPPLTSLPFPKSSDLPLPPIDGDPNYRPERSAYDGLSLINSAGPVYFASDDFQPTLYRDESHRMSALGARTYPLNLLLSENDIGEHPPSSLSKILEDPPVIHEEGITKKRARALNAKDDFVQLPQPVKKQKPGPQAPVMPPIINGLHEPPPDAALFPPIDSSTFAEYDTAKLSFLQEWIAPVDEKQQDAQCADEDKCGPKAKKRAVKPRSKWGEEETKNLLLGVSRYGVGKWKNIMEDQEFHFNNRTAGDLKDRFRTCCPDELRGSKKMARPKEKGKEQGAKLSKGQKKSTDLDKILINVEELHDTVQGFDETDNAGDKAADSTSTPKRSRAHRKKMQDLAELGIHAPFRPSGRRERRPFTDEEDRCILDGLDVYGPAWTKIQRDPRFKLSSRQPTDLRDRIRNGYPSIFQRIEKGTFNAKGATRGNDIMEPSVVTTIGNGLARPPAAATDQQVIRTASREELPRWPLQLLDTSDAPMSPQGLELGDSVGPVFMGGEMDISRLLLDDSRPA